MTTFTRIPDEEMSTISVNSKNIICKIEDHTYGGFTE